jgi:hypothetical protein
MVLVSPDEIAEGPRVGRYDTRELQRVLDLAGGVIELRNLRVTADPLSEPLQIRGTYDAILIDSCVFESGLLLSGVRSDAMSLTDVVCGDGDKLLTLQLARCQVSSRLLLTTRGHEVSADQLRIRHCHLPAGATIVSSAEEVELTGTVFGSPSSLSAGGDAFKGVLPRLLTVSSAAVGALRVEGFDLRTCRFRGAHGLEDARFARCQWPRSPGTAPRRVVTEEVLWRHAWPTWQLGPWRVPALSGDSKRGQSGALGLPPRRWPKMSKSGYDPHAHARGLTAGEVEEIYRALHRGAVADRQWAAAADYQWGESVMRRIAGRERLPAEGTGRARRNAGVSDRALLRAYRLVGGLGLRARWPLAWLLVLLLCFSALLGSSGFESNGRFCTIERACWTRSPHQHVAAGRFLRSVSFTSGFIVATERPAAGDVQPWVPGAVTAGRILGLTLLGFSAVALRSRVRR